MKIADFSIHYIEDIPYNVQIGGVFIKDNKFIFKNIISHKELEIDQKDLEEFKKFVRLNDTIPNTVILLSELATFDAGKVLATKLIPSDVLIRACSVKDGKIDKNTLVLVNTLDNDKENLIFIGDDVPDEASDLIDSFVYKTNGQVDEKYTNGTRFVFVMGKVTSGKVVKDYDTQEVYIVEDSDLEYNMIDVQPLYDCVTIQNNFKAFNHMRTTCQFIIKNLLSHCKE